MPASKSLPVPSDIEEFLQHWQGVTKAGLIPGLRDFLNVRAFKLQSEVAIVDVVGPTEMRFRLFGTGLSSIAGHDLTGTDVLSQFHPHARAEASRIAWTAVSRPCGYILHRTLRRGIFETNAVGIGLPVLHEQSGKVGLVGFSSTLGKAFGVTDVGESPFVNAVDLMKWIDIGAGVPESTQATQAK